MKMSDIKFFMSVSDMTNNRMKPPNGSINTVCIWRISTWSLYRQVLAQFPYEEETHETFMWKCEHIFYMKKSQMKPLPASISTVFIWRRDTWSLHVEVWAHFLHEEEPNEVFTGKYCHSFHMKKRHMKPSHRIINSFHMNSHKKPLHGSISTIPMWRTAT